MKEILLVYQQCQICCFSHFLICQSKGNSQSFICYRLATTCIYVNSSFIVFNVYLIQYCIYLFPPLLTSCCCSPSGAYFHMNVRERHETQCHVESGVFIVPLIVMVIYIYIYIYEGLIHTVFNISILILGTLIWACPNLILSKIETTVEHTILVF